MKITRLEAENFRNIEKSQIELCPEINIFYGDNAQGKTNILEALWLFTGGKSFRGSKDCDLINFNQTKSLLSIEFDAGKRPQTAQIAIENNKRTAKMNGISQDSPSKMWGNLCMVVFSPEHLEIIKGGPELRRRFLDSAICQLKRRYASDLNEYTRILTQRNSLLKDIPRHAQLIDMIDVWDVRAAKTGAKIISARLGYIEKLTPKAQEYYDGISSGKEKLTIKYNCTGYNQQEILDQSEMYNFLYEAIKASFKADMEAGYTKVGPHRDDLEISIDGNSSRSFGSQGQQRSAILALKLAEASIIMEQAEESPILLLDDVMSELDLHRQQFILNNINGWQVFITCCDPSSKLKGKVFNVCEGKVNQMKNEK